MSSDAPHIASPSEPGVLTAATIAGSHNNPYLSPSVTAIHQSLPIAPQTPLVVQSFSTLILSIDALPLLFTRTNIVAPELLECASPLTQRALSYLRRSALRTAEEGKNPPLSKIKNGSSKLIPLLRSGPIPSTIRNADDHVPPMSPPTIEHEVDDDVNNSPFYSFQNSCSSREFPPPLAHLRVLPSHAMTSTSATASPKNSTVAANSTK